MEFHQWDVHVIPQPVHVGRKSWTDEVSATNIFRGLVQGVVTYRRERDNMREGTNVYHFHWGIVY